MLLFSANDTDLSLVLVDACEFFVNCEIFDTLELLSLCDVDPSKNFSKLRFSVYDCRLIYIFLIIFPAFSGVSTEII